MSAPHLSLSLSRELWNELLTAALPVKLAGGSVDLIQATRGAVRQLGVRQRVRGLLEDRRAPPMVKRVGHRARSFWRERKASVYQRVDNVVRVEATWKVELDDLGTELRYGRQRVDADAYARAVVEGTVFLLSENLEIPFTLERRVGASLALTHIRYDRGKQAVVASLADVGLYLGDNILLQLASRLGETVIEQQMPGANPVTLLKRERVSEMVGPMGGALKMKMDVEDIQLVVDEHDLRLNIRFGFTRAQLTDDQPTV